MKEKRTNSKWTRITRIIIHRDESNLNHKNKIFYEVICEKALTQLIHATEHVTMVKIICITVE